MKHGRPSLYEHLEKNKQGITGVSSNRVVPYQEEWEAAGNTGQVPIICNVNFHHLPVPFQHKMVDEAIQLGRKYTFLPDEYPKTTGDDLLLDSKGLPSSTQKAIHGIVYSKEESPAFGGGIVVSGQLARFIMCLCETGVQASRERRGLPTNRNANLHEWACSNATGGYVCDDMEVRSNVDTCFAKMKPSTRDPLLRDEYDIAVLMLARAPGRMKSKLSQ